MKIEVWRDLRDGAYYLVQLNNRSEVIAARKVINHPLRYVLSVAIIPNDNAALAHIKSMRERYVGAFYDVTALYLSEGGD